MYKKFFSKLFLKIFGIELIFILLFFLLSSFFIGKIYGIIVVMQGIGSLLSGYENVDNNIELDQAAELSGLVNELNSNLGNLAIYSLLFLLIGFLLYVFLKSLEWNLILNEKLKNYKDYLKKFTLITLLVILILIPLFYFILVASRQFLLSYLFGGTILKKESIELILLSIVSVFSVYLGFNGYFYINEERFVIALKKIFKFKKFKNYFVLLLLFFVSALIIRYGLILSTSVFNIAFLVILVSFIFTWYKFYFIDNTKK